MVTIILFFVIAFFAAIIASLTGFGSATLLIPFAALVIGLKQAIVLVAFFHFFSNAFKLLRLRRSVDWRLLLLYGIPSILAAYVGAMLFNRLNIDVISITFAGFIIIFAVYSLVNPAWSLPDRKSVLVFGGALSGLTAGLIGVGGAIRSMFLISTKIKKEVYIATSAAIAVVVDTTRLSVYLYHGSLEASYYWYIVPLIAIAFLGTFVGVKLLTRLSGLLVKRLVLVLLILVGIRMLLGQYGVF